MVTIGYRPILWHVMRYYAHFGHRDFVLCLGYKGDAIKDYFLHYDEAVSNDFVLSDGGRHIELLTLRHRRLADHLRRHRSRHHVGERLRRVRHLLEGEEMFLANYGDTLTDAPLDRLVEEFSAGDAVARSWPSDRQSTPSTSSRWPGASACDRCSPDDATSGSTAATSCSAARSSTISSPATSSSRSRSAA